jgi:TolA-binding protein
MSMFADVIRQYPQNGSAYAARYDVGALRKKVGNTAGAVQMFRNIERDDRAPAAIAARAMFSRAAILEQQGAWDESYALLQRLQQLYPYTAAAVEAPLAITRHYSAAGEPELARRALDRARDYYLGLLDRTSQFQGDRLVVQAALTESYVAAGDAADVAELLGSGSPQWDETSTAAGMLKSAEVYASVLHEPDQAVAMLKKCIERFPETRYSKVAQARLDELEGRSR